MNFKEKLSPSAQKKLSDLLFILYAGGAALLSYSLVYALRKPFTAATFDGMELFGMDYKIATSIIQIFGYMVSKFIGIKLISELKREGRLKFILVSILVAELSLVLFGCLPRPFNVLALFFNGLSLGCMWGVIFSFLEGRRVTDLLASLFGLSIAVSSGTAKSIGLFVVDTGPGPQGPHIPAAAACRGSGRRKPSPQTRRPVCLWPPRNPPAYRGPAA